MSFLKKNFRPELFLNDKSLDKSSFLMKSKLYIKISRTDFFLHVIIYYDKYKIRENYQLH